MAKVTTEEKSSKEQSVDSNSEASASRPSGGAWRRRLPLLPALIFQIALTQIPFAFSIYYSLTNWNLTAFSPPRMLVWFENYVDLISDPTFRDAIWVTITLTVLSVALSIIFGLALASLLDRKFFGQGFVRTLLITPFLITPVVSALVWREQILSANFGVLNWFLEQIGLSSVEFTTAHAYWSVMFIIVWQWTPFMMLILLAGLQSQDSSVLEAAKVDGASRSATFFQITLPHLRRYIELGILLGVVYISQVFDQIQILAGRLVGTKNVAFEVFDTGFNDLNLGLASAQSIITVVGSIIVATIGLKFLSNLLEEAS